MFPLKIEDISETKADVVAAGPAPSPCIMFLPTGFAEGESREALPLEKVTNGVTNL